MIKTKFNGREICLFMNGWAMFELDEIKVAWNDGHVETVDRISGTGELLSKLDAERLPILAQTAEILQRAANSANRALGLDGFEVVPADQILALAKPKDLPALQNAVMQAIIDGFKTDAEHDEVVDVFMVENMKKKISEDPAPSI